MSSTCFICSDRFTFDTINEHERNCLNSLTINDVQYTRKKNAKNMSSLYQPCHLCGKLYSQHSMHFHVKQCEKLHVKLKCRDTSSFQKIKPRSLLDTTRSSIVNIHHSPTQQLDSAYGKHSKTKRYQLSAEELQVNVTNCIEELTSMGLISMDSVGAKNTTRLPNKTKTQVLKCRFCQQVYGKHSLIIHEKQCRKNPLSARHIHNVS